MFLIDLVGRSGGVQVLGSSPERMIEGEFTNLSVQDVLAYVTLDEVIRGPFDGSPNLIQLTGGVISLWPTDRAPSQKRRRGRHREAELNEVTGCRVNDNE